MSLSGKFFAIYASIVFVFGGILSWVAVELGEYSDDLNQFHASVQEIPRILQSKRSENRTLSVILTSSSPKRMPQLIRETLKNRVDFNYRLMPLVDRGAFPVQNGSLKAKLPRLQQLDERLYRDFTESFSKDEPPAVAVLRRLRTRLTVFDQSLELFTLEVQRSINESVNHFRQRKHELTWSFIWGGALALLFGIVALILTQRLFAPLKALKEGLGKLSMGDLNNRIPDIGDDELGAIAAEFNAMAEAISKRDVQLQEQQARLLQREQLATVGKMSAQITHELRNPLSSIGLNSELLLEELEQPRPSIDLPASQELLRNITKEVDRLRDITEEYLQFSRLPRPEKTSIRLDLLGQEILEFMASELAQAEVKWRVDPESAPRSVEADPNQLRSAIINLIRNAKEATGPGGHIVVRTRTIGRESRLEVIDDGTGIPEDTQGQLFAPFFSTKPNGTGLGLSLVRHIMEAQGGQVSLESKVGQGTTVRLSLPG